MLQVEPKRKYKYCILDFQLIIDAGVACGAFPRPDKRPMAQDEAWLSVSTTSDFLLLRSSSFLQKFYPSSLLFPPLLSINPTVLC